MFDTDSTGKRQADERSEARSSLDDFVARADDPSLVRQALEETDPLTVGGGVRRALVVPGQPAGKDFVARGWVRRAQAIPATAGVRFVDRRRWEDREMVALGRARPSVQLRSDGSGGQIATFALRLRTAEVVEGTSELVVLGRMGDLTMVQATAAGVQQLRDRFGMAAVSMARPLLACEGGAAPAGLGAVHTDTGATGEGVLIGIADFRIDIYHSNLRNPDGSTRIAALWDQEATYAGVGQPGPGGLGVVYSAADLDAELLGAAAPYQHVPHRWMVGDGTSIQEVHGTHVAAMAIGSGASKPLPHTGAAPGARLLFVNLRTELQMLDEGARFDFAMEDAVLAAVDWMDLTAREGRHGVPAGSPLVVSLSLADYTGPRDGSGLSADLSAALAGRENRAIVMAAGNGDDPSVHARVELLPNIPTEVVIEYASNAAASDLIEIFSPDASIDVALKAPDFGAGPSVLPVTTGHQAEGMAPGPGGDQVKVGLAAPAMPINVINDYRVRVRLAGQPGVDTPLQGRWTLAIRSSGGAPVMADIYASIANEERRIFAPASQGRYTVSDLASSPEVLTVGAHLVPLTSEQARPIWGDSGRGPTRAAATKPDLATEGANVRSCQPRGRWRVEDKAMHLETVRTGYLSGTSLAAPVAAGALACRMQRLGLTAGGSMSMADIHADFRGLVSLDTASMEDGSRDAADLQAAFGAGYLDADKLAGGPVS